MRRRPRISMRGTALRPTVWHPDTQSTDR